MWALSKRERGRKEKKRYRVQTDPACGRVAAIQLSGLGRKKGGVHAGVLLLRSELFFRQGARESRRGNHEG